MSMSDEAWRKIEWVDVIITFRQHPKASDRSLVASYGGQRQRKFKHFKVLSTRLPKKMIPILARQPRIESITLDSPVMGFSASAMETAAMPTPGSSGWVSPLPSVGIAVVDSGVGDHWDLDVTTRVDCTNPIAAVTETVRDNFVLASWNGDDGSLPWNGPWVEIGESDGADNGEVHVGNSGCTSGTCLHVHPAAAVGLWRSVDLSTASSATLSFGYGSNASGGAVLLELSTDGGVSWTTLATYDVIASASGTETVDLGPYLFSVPVASAPPPVLADTRLRFNASGYGNGRLSIDDFEVEYQTDAIACPTVSGTADLLDDPLDPFGHGSHVAGTASGSGWMSNGTETGGAQGAPIISVRVLADDGRGVVSDVLAGLDWVLQNAAAENIRVVNLSLGKSVDESADLDPLVQAVEQIWDAGIVVVASAGNYGRDGHFTVTSPGNSRKIITVGSLTDNGTGSDFTDDYVSTFSSRGPTLLDHYLKPDLVAPGNRVVAAIPNGSYLKTSLPTRVFGCTLDPVCLGGDYLRLSGTSMAAGMVSGAAALMLSLDPGLNPATIKGRLMRSARKIPEDATIVGAGVLDVEAALAETGYLAYAPSPHMARSAEGPVILVEDTGQLWGPEWAAGYIWSDAYIWSDSYVSADGYIWSDAYIWSEGYIWSDAYIWSEGYIWSDAYIWSEGYIWSDNVANSDPLFAESMGNLSLNDDP